MIKTFFTNSYKPIGMDSFIITIFNRTFSTTSKKKELIIIENYLLKDLQDHFFFNKKSKQWYEFNNGIWSNSHDIAVRGKILTSLDALDSIKITASLLDKIEKCLRLLLAGDIDKKNVNGEKFLPFQNGVLNLNTHELLPYSNNQRFFYKYGVSYDPKAKMSIYFVAWLLQMSQRNLLYLNIIRNFVYLLITNNNSFKTALYLYGPTDTYTFEEFLRSILSREGTASLGLSLLNDELYRFRLIHSSLLIISDFNSKKNLSVLNNIIKSKTITTRRNCNFEFQPSCLVLFTNNQIWPIISTVPEFSDHIIYLPLNKPKNFIFGLSTLDFFGNKTLFDSFPGFINWVLANPSDNLKLFEDIGKLNKRIDSNKILNNNSLVNFNYFSGFLDISQEEIDLLDNLDAY